MADRWMVSGVQEIDAAARGAAPLPAALVTGDMAAAAPGLPGRAAAPLWAACAARGPLPLALAVAGKDGGDGLRVAHDMEALRRIGRLRHRRGLRPDGAALPGAGPGCLIEPADLSALNLWTGPGPRVEAALRLGRIDDPADPDRPALLAAAARLGLDPALALGAARLVADPAAGGAPAAALAGAARRRMAAAGFRACLVRAGGPLARHLARLGFAPVGGAGRDAPPVLVLDLRGPATGPGARP